MYSDEETPATISQFDWKEMKSLMDGMEARLGAMQEIIMQLDTNTISGLWPNQACHYCAGRSTGYNDSQGFEHQRDCVVLKIEQLRRSTYTH